MKFWYSLADPFSTRYRQELQAAAAKATRLRAAKAAARKRPSKKKVPGGTLPEQGRETIKSFKQTFNAAVLMSVRQRAPRPAVPLAELHHRSDLGWTYMPGIHQLSLGR